jgi:hypothetical protein
MNPPRIVDPVERPTIGTAEKFPVAGCGQSLDSRPEFWYGFTIPVIPCGVIPTFRTPVSHPGRGGPGETGDGRPEQA